MKKINKYLSIVVILFFFAACEERDTITSPSGVKNSSSMTKEVIKNPTKAGELPTWNKISPYDWYRTLSSNVTFQWSQAVYSYVTGLGVDYTFNNYKIYVDGQIVRTIWNYQTTSWSTTLAYNALHNWQVVATYTYWNGSQYIAVDIWYDDGYGNPWDLQCGPVAPINHGIQWLPQNNPLIISTLPVGGLMTGSAKYYRSFDGINYSYIGSGSLAYIDITVTQEYVISHGGTVFYKLKSVLYGEESPFSNVKYSIVKYNQ